MDDERRRDENFDAIENRMTSWLADQRAMGCDITIVQSVMITALIDLHLIDPGTAGESKEVILQEFMDRIKFNVDLELKDAGGK